jgi:hypothetical protein
MKVKEVPQDNQNKIYKRGDTKYLHYAVDDSGKIVPVMSKGWDVLETSIKSLGKMFSDLAEDAHERVRKGETSPLEYFMYSFQLDLQQFSDQTGISKRKLKKHFDPGVFDKLDDKTLQNYADFFDIDVNKIKNFKKGLK